MPPLVAGAIMSAAGITGAAATTFVSAGALTAAGAITLATNAAFLVAGAAVSRSMQRRQLRRQQSELQDRRFTVRTSAEPQQIVLGRTRVGGVQLAAGWTHGENREYWSVPVAFAAHQVDAIEDIWLGEESVGPLVGVGPTQQVQPGSKFYLQAQAPQVTIVSGGIAGGQVSLDGGLAGIRIETVAFEVMGSGASDDDSYMRSRTLVPGTDYVVDRDSADNLRITWVTDWTLYPELTVTWVRETGYSCLSVRKFLGVPAGETDADLEADSEGEWKATDLGREMARCKFVYRWNSDIYPNGPPNPTAIIRGVRAYDPRKDSTNGGSGAHRLADASTWEWTRNPALLWAWYMTWSGGGRRPASRLDWPSVITAANVCDEAVPRQNAQSVLSIQRGATTTVTTSGDHGLVAGELVLFNVTGTTGLNTGSHVVASTPTSNTFTVAYDSSAQGAFGSGTVQHVQVRYTCDGVLSTGDDVRVNADKILSSMVGTRFCSGGKWYVRAGAYVAPTIDLADDDFAPGEIVVRPRPKIRDAFNSVKGLFVDGHAPGAYGADDPGGQWAVTDFPPYASSTYISEDNGEELWEEIELPLVQDPWRAQRIAKLILFRHRQGLVIEAPWKWKAYRAQPGDTVRITSAINGWNLKVFRVIDRIHAPHGDTKLVLQEEASAVYAWDFSEAANPDPAPNTLLPDPRLVDAIQNLRISTGASYLMPDGTQMPYADITWDAITDSAVLSGGRVEVWFKRAADTAYQKRTVLPSETYVRIQPVAAGDTLHAFAWAFNGSQVRSPIVFATRTLASTLPAAGVAPPISANLLANASYISIDAQTLPRSLEAYAANTVQYVGIQPVWWAPTPVPPHAAMLGVGTMRAGLPAVSPDSGDGHYAWLLHPLVRVQAGARYCAYVRLLPFECDAQVYIAWRGASGEWIAESWGTVVPSVGSADLKFTTKRPDILSNYEYSQLFARAPEGARFAHFAWGAARNWTAANVKEVHGIEPFFGRVADNVVERPPWDPGGQPTVNGSAIVPGSVTVTDSVTWTENGTEPYWLAVGSSSTPIAPMPIGGRAEAGDVVLWTITGQVSVPADNWVRYAIRDVQITDGLGNTVNAPDWMSLYPGNRQPILLTGSFVQGEGEAATASVGLRACSFAWGAQLHTITTQIVILKR